MTLESLKKEFGECKRTDTCACTGKTSYEVASQTVFCIFDEKDDEPIRIVSGKDEHQLIVRNQNKDKIHVVKTDKCLFTSQHKKCDCILFNNSNIYLVEIKGGGTGTKSNNRQKAIVQLGDTIKLLKDNGISLSNHQTKAIICFREGKTRPTQPSLNTQRATFLEDYNVSLEEGNEIIF